MPAESSENAPIQNENQKPGGQTPLKNEPQPLQKKRRVLGEKENLLEPLPAHSQKPEEISPPPKEQRASPSKQQTQQQHLASVSSPPAERRNKTPRIEASGKPALTQASSTRSSSSR